MLRATLCLLVAFSARADSLRDRQVDRVFSPWDKTDSPGCALSVVRDGKAVYQRGYGMADLDHDIAISAGSRFHVASISKQFTAAATILLALRGKLSLDDPVGKHIPGFPDFGGRTVTLRHLMHHSSGLRDQWNLLALAGWRLSEDVVRDGDVMEMALRQRDLNFNPGDEYLYSNTGFTLLAQVVKNVSGKRFREFTRKEIFEPLGMTQTFFRDDHREIVKNIAYGYASKIGGGFRQSIPQYDNVGPSSLITTVDDMGKWDAELRNPKVFGQPWLEEMLREYQLNSGEKISYRSGLIAGSYRGLPIFEHDGSDAGYRSEFLQFPRNNLSVICLCNTANNPRDLARKVADVYLAGDLAPVSDEAYEPVRMTAEEMRQRAGLYWNPLDESVYRFVVRGGRLRVQIGNAFEDAEATFQADGALLQIGSGKPRQLKKVEEFHGNVNDFTGAYYSRELDVTYTLTAEEGKLMVRRKKSITDTLEPTFEDAFRCPGLGYLRFERDAAGSIRGFHLTSRRIRRLRFERRP